MNITSGKNIAIVTLTKGGVAQGLRLLEQLPEANLYVSESSIGSTDNSKVKMYEERVGELIGRLFQEGHSLVVFAAMGIVVRSLAPVLKNKTEDAPVVVVDEKAQHAVCVLSGHQGGGNVLTQFVAKALGSDPVITTASDVKGLPSLDILGQQFGWTLEDSTGLPRAMSALVNEQPLLIFQNAGELHWWKGQLPDHVHVVNTLEVQELSEYRAVIMITDQTLDYILSNDLDRTQLPPLVVYRPQTLVLGFGCERGVSVQEVEEAVEAALHSGGLALNSVTGVASIDAKQDEVGLLAFITGHSLTVHWYTADQLKNVDSPNPSAMVQRHMGTPGVAEPSAVLASGHGQLVSPKLKHGRVTVAVARVVQQASPPGHIVIVGLGPGERLDLTPRARMALAQADVVVGYQRYLDQIQDLLTHQEVIPGELTKERERAETTVVRAEEGKHVVLVSSGDSGIYGMAGLVYEILDSRGWDASTGVQVEVVPGITALSSCGSLLGAPLMHDFAAISLSNLLTPWPVIVKRLEAAAQGDFVIALYNPKSARRIAEFDEACHVLLRYRSPETVVGLVARAGRPGFRREVTTLAHLHTCEVDMETTIFIGNASTRLVGDRMVTPRGYLGSTSHTSQSDSSPAQTMKASA